MFYQVVPPSSLNHLWAVWLPAAGRSFHRGCLHAGAFPPLGLLCLALLFWPVTVLPLLPSLPFLVPFDSFTLPKRLRSWSF